ncbi:chemotaxis protein [uncultured Campylobacter sp.]|uniref:chemotaxis protein n=1 Tax=uncultured Campylobacter sp. TaxID=218934 RepID=UPI00261B3DA2|nr:chemotaxis protein [uncultured Campylobacter sp.]
MLKAGIVYKFALIVLIGCALCILGFSGAYFARGEYDEAWMGLHKIAGLGLLCVAILHLITRRKKLAKLWGEFLDVVLRRKNPGFCNMDRIIGAIEHYNIREIAGKMGFEPDELATILKSNGIKLVSADQDLRELAKLNDEKIFFILVLLIEAKFGKADGCKV